MPIKYTGLIGSARSWLISAIKKREERVLVICEDQKTAEEFQNDLSFFIGPNEVSFFPAWDTLPFEPVSPQSFISAERILTLASLRDKPSFLCVSSCESILQKTIIPEKIREHSFNISKGDTFSINEIKARLSPIGFVNVSVVEDVGEFALQGTVIDIFASTCKLAYRLELHGDTVTRICTFEPEGQRTIEEISSIQILPIREYISPKNLFLSNSQVQEVISRIKVRARFLETPPRETARIISSIRSGEPFPGCELYWPFVYDGCCLFDYLPPDTRIIIVNASQVEKRIETFVELIAEREKRFSSEHYLTPPSDSLYLEPSIYKSRLTSLKVDIIDDVSILAGNTSDNVLNIPTLSNIELETKLKTKIGSGKALSPLSTSVKALRKKNFSICFTVGSPIRAERLRKELLSYGIDIHILSKSGQEWIDLRDRFPIVVLQGYLHSGFQLPLEQLAFINESEIFAERSYRRASKTRVSLKRILSSLANLKESDFVVHVDYGIGVYRGLKQIEVEGLLGDFLHIEYADSILYLPVQNIGKIQKFLAAEGQQPVLDKLSNPNRWIKTKQKVRESIESLAGDLIKLYAVRSVTKGWRFDSAGAEDERFADEFPYDETPDQLKAINDTLVDMANAKPMDRLVCGDVGFGKTEVAIRGAFKCIQHARQVAILAPTTILVEQHRKNFEERFKDYPVILGAVSRLYSPKINTDTLQKVSEGQIDIVIGTHRLLSRDVKFKDLGLLIIDEEHRFGVKQKERLKQLKKNVDVLTLTATPIPRTLHMSLLGIRDISIISTPPTDRRAIRTYIALFDENLIRDAVLKEMSRGGQTFFVHNRIETLPTIAADIKKFVPEARVKFAHGQMREHEMEKIMEEFLQKKIDVLVSTTIVESGLDIPNANTMIIHNADKFGLAQLYQLRGRVGRSDKQAYAYFLVPKHRQIGLEAQKRLKALQSLDDLGLGFNLAVRDLEIRGAGNLLGREQSGNVLSVGYELYSRILKEVVSQIQGEDIDFRDSIDPELKFKTTAFLPDSYIPDISERLVLYQRLASLQSEQEADDIESEILDRFGQLPDEVVNYLELMRFRLLLKNVGVVRAEEGTGQIVLYLSPEAHVNVEKIFEIEKQSQHLIKFGKNLSLTIRIEAEFVGNIKAIREKAEGVLKLVSME